MRLSTPPPAGRLIGSVGRCPEARQEPGAGKYAPPTCPHKFRKVADLRRHLIAVSFRNNLFDRLLNAAAGMDAVKRAAHRSDRFPSHFRSAAADGVVRLEPAITQRPERWPGVQSGRTGE